MQFADPIYGSFILPLNLQRAIAHPNFQRLYHIAQLGFTQFCPGLENLRHSRAEHSIGTAYLAGIVANHLHLSPEQREVLQMAGLLHDCGQGPMSHSFEKIVTKRHEERSQQIAQLILQNIYDPMQILTICYLIDPGGVPPTSLAGQLRDVINNKVCFLDCDKVDYLLRDSYYAGLDFCSLGEITDMFNRSELEIDSDGYGMWRFSRHSQSTICRIFEHRANMFSKIYRHPNNLRLESQMIKAAQQLNIDWCNLPTFLEYTDVKFLELLSSVSEGQNLLKGDCPDILQHSSHPDPQSPTLVMKLIPYCQ